MGNSGKPKHKLGLVKHYPIFYKFGAHSDNCIFKLVIGKVISDHPGQVFDQKNQFTVHVERLDSILAASKMKIGLMKMDAQGFECRIVEGMGDVAEIIDVMKFEYAYPWLHSHGCFDLVSLLMKNFDIYTGFHDGVFSGLTNDIEVSANTNTVFDLFASKRNS